MLFTFGEFKTNILFNREIPRLEQIAAAAGLAMNDKAFKPLVICDENTSYIADIICEGFNTSRCVLKSGEENKNWESIQSILKAAFDAGLGRDAFFIAVGGGVIGDLAGFAASIYMRGCRFVLVSTTLLGMVDASVGGKTGFDLFGIKNLIGTFFPAQCVFIPADTLSTLPEKEWKSGIAELIKHGILDTDDYLDEIAKISSLCASFSNCKSLYKNEMFIKCIERSVFFKASIVSEDLYEKGKRALLNLGHTFAHGLEAAAGLGSISHGEAVAWGIVRACALGVSLGITPLSRAEKIREILTSFGYEIKSPHPSVKDSGLIFSAMNSDKKKKDGALHFIVPDTQSARIVNADFNEVLDTVQKIINGEISF